MTDKVCGDMYEKLKEARRPRNYHQDIDNNGEDYISDEENKADGSSSVVETCIGTTYYRGEIQFLMAGEYVQHLDDLVLRRTLLGMQGQLSMPLLKELADIGQIALGWSDERRQDELNRTLDILKDRHGVVLV